MDTNINQLQKFLDMLYDEFIKNPDLEKVITKDGFIKDPQSILETNPELSVVAKIIEGIIVEADSALIDERGANFAAHLKLAIQSSNRYRVRCGEKDSFGWLSGIIYCDKFSISYG